MLRLTVPRSVNTMFSGFTGSMQWRHYSVLQSGQCRPNCRSKLGLNLRVKVLVEALSPSVEGPTATAATLMLYWDPGVRPSMMKEVSVVVFSTLTFSPAKRIVYEVAFPFGFAQLRDRDEAVTLVTVRFLTTSGSVDVRDDTRVTMPPERRIRVHVSYRKRPLLVTAENV